MLYLSSCSIVKNEYPYILEFYKIHKHLGVESFLFYDRSTEGPPLTELFKNNPDVTVINFPEPNRHAHAWLEGIKYFTGKSKWVQFIDIDQVVVPVQTNDIKTMLQPYEAYASLGLNWHSFGSSGLEVEPTDSSTYEAYIRRAEGDAPINTHIQSIVQPDRISYRIWSDPHHPPVNPGETQINENHGKFSGPFNRPPTQNVGFIAHYYTRSRAYWERKIAKTRADTGTSGGTMQDFDHHQTYMNNIEDLKVSNVWKSIKI
jgi:hypothetical protein